MLKRRERRIQHRCNTLQGAVLEPENSGIEACRSIGAETNKKLFHELFQHRSRCGQSKLPFIACLPLSLLASPISVSFPHRERQAPHQHGSARPLWAVVAQ